IDASGTPRNVLEVRTTVPHRLEAESLEFAGDVGGGLVVPRLTHAAPLHGIVRDAVESCAQIVRRDRLRGRARRPLERTALVGPDATAGAGSCGGGWGRGGTPGLSSRGDERHGAEGERKCGMESSLHGEPPG